MGELDLARSASCQRRERQPLSSVRKGRAAVSAVKLPFGLTLDARRGEVMLVCWQHGRMDECETCPELSVTVYFNGNKITNGGEICFLMLFLTW